MESLLVTSRVTVQVGSSEQAGTGAMAGSREQLGKQGWTDRVRLQVISRVGGSGIRLQQLSRRSLLHDS